jgi:hypothetical protein
MAVTELLPDLAEEPSLLELLYGGLPAEDDEPVSPELALVAPPEERRRLLEQLPEPSFDEWVVQLRRRFEAEQALRSAPPRLSRRERIAGVLVMTCLVAGSAVPIALQLLVLR